MCSGLVLKLAGAKYFCSTGKTGITIRRPASKCSRISLLAREISPFQRALSSRCLSFEGDFALALQESLV